MKKAPRSPQTIIPFRRPGFANMARLTLMMIAMPGLGLVSAQAANKYWDTTAGSGNGVGGSGTWGTTFSTSSTGDTNLTTAATGDDDIFQGTAGTITLSGAQTANSLTFNTTGYKITGNSTTNRVLTGSISLANNVNLTIGNGETTDIAIGVGSVSGGTGSGLTINGAATGAAVTRLNLASASANISVPITISGTGFANIAGTATGTQVSGNITGNGSRLNLGATSGNDITFSGTINNGTGAIRIAAGSSGGAGVVILSNSGNTWGATELNNAASGILRMGAVNALPTATTLTYGVSTGNGASIVELNGKNTTIGQITNGTQSGGTLRNTSATAATLTISGTDTSAAAFSGSIQDGTGAGVLSLVRSGTGTTTLSGSNTYTGTTQINGGTLVVTGTLGSTNVSLSNANSTLVTGSATAMGGTLTANNGTVITIGGIGSIGTLTVGAVTLNGGSTLNFDIATASSYDKINTTGVLTLGSGTQTINIGTAATGTYTLVSGYSSLSGSGAFSLGSLASGFNYSLATGSNSTVLTVSSLGGSANLTWSLGGATPSSSTDGAGTWTNGGTNFYNTGTSAANTWDNTGTYNLTVGSSGTGGTITLGGNVRVGGTLTFATVNSPYTIGTSSSTNTLTLAGGITANNSATIYAPIVLEASQSWNVATGKTLAANGSISESGSLKTLTKDGAGTLVLTGTNNTYSGGTTINTGTLSLSAGSSAGTGSVTVNSAGTLAGGGTVNGATTVNSGSINGSGLALTGLVTFNGSGNSLSGTVSSASGSSLAASASVTNSGTLTVSGTSVGVTVNGNNASVTNLGTINQTGTGRGFFNASSTGLTITNGSTGNSTALIQTADADAVRSNTGGVTLNNYGTITSLNASVGGSQAVDFNPITSGSNTINNYATGVMQATDADAVRPGVSGTVYNAGLIKSTISTFSGTNNGLSSDGVDVQANNNVQINNDASGTIEGGRHGITGGPSSDINFTTIITNSAGGTIKGNSGSGINLDGLSSKQTATITNNGTIIGNGINIGTGASRDGDGVDVDGVVNLTNTGIIRSVNSYNIATDGIAHSEGITIGGGTVINSGTVEGLVASGNTNATGYGITLLGNDITTGPNAGKREAIYANATITNQAGGLIRGDSASGIAVLGGFASGYSVTINNNANATIRGGATLTGLEGTLGAIRAGEDSITINNAGIIDGSSNGKAITGSAGNITLNITGGAASILGDITGGTGTNAFNINPGASNSFSYSGVISNFNSVEIMSGLVTFSGANSYNGTTQIDTNAELDLTGSGTIGNTTTLTLQSGSIFNLGGKTITVGNLSNSGAINNGTVLTSSGTLSGLSGSAALTQSTGTNTLSGTNSYSGATTVSGGKLNLSGTISSSATTVSGGGEVHLVNGTAAAVTLNSGGSLTGNGTVGALTVNSGGNLSPGNSPGTVNAGDTTFNAGGSFTLQVNTDGSTGSAGTNWDQLSITGKLDLSSLSPTSTFSIVLQTLDGSNVINPLTTFDANSYHLWAGVILTTDGFTGSFNPNDFTFDLSNFKSTVNGTFSLVQNGNNLDLQYQTVPEPSTNALLIGGLLVLALVANRRRQQA